jgi:hypothetical protein
MKSLFLCCTFLLIALLGFSQPTKDNPVFAKSDFNRVTQRNKKAVIHYDKGKTRVRSAQFTDKDMVELTAWINAAATNPKITMKGVSIDAYGSPSCSGENGEALAHGRANSAKAVMVDIMKTAGITAGTKADFYRISLKGEDWAEFKRLLEPSPYRDKEIIIRVFEMYRDPVKRCQELKNLTQTYAVIEEQIFPLLARAEIVLEYQHAGRTDVELLRLAKTNPDSLTVEELLFTANTLLSNNNEKLALYKRTQVIYPKDWRATNNAGCIYLLQNKISDAKQKFDRAYYLEENPTILQNIKIIDGLMGK